MQSPLPSQFVADRWPALDGVRALSALAVIAFHARLPGGQGGFLGVELFFVLSGFLITTLLRKELSTTGTVDLLRFWGRRVARLCPMLALVVAVFVLVAPWLFPDANLAQEVWLTLFYLSDYSVALWDTPVVLQHSWSLSVEMQFYLFWPLLILLLCRLSPRQGLAVLVALFVVATAWRFAAFELWGRDRVYYALDTRMSGLILGAALAFVGWRPTAVVGNLMGVAALVLLVLLGSVLGFRSVAGHTLGLLLVDICAAMLMFALRAPRNLVSGVLALPALVRLGAWSYGIYLWHFPIARLAREAIDPVSAFAVTVALSVALAGLSYELFERHATSWLRRRWAS